MEAGDDVSLGLLEDPVAAQDDMSTTTTTNSNNSYGEKPVVSKTSRFNMLAYFYFSCWLICQKFGLFFETTGFETTGFSPYK